MLVQRSTTRCLRSLILKKRFVFFESSKVEIVTLVSDSKEINVLCNKNGKQCQFEPKRDAEIIFLQEKCMRFSFSHKTILNGKLFKNVLY